LKANLAQPLHRQIARALRWMIDDVVTGTAARIFRASWQIWLHLFTFQLGLLTWLAMSIAMGVLVGRAATAIAGAPLLIGLVAGVAVTILVVLALRPLAGRWFIIRVNNCWPYLREFGRGQATCFDRPIQIAAERLKAAADANEVDEIILIGHSAGGPLVPAVLARALRSDPDLGRRGPHIVMLTLGSLMPGLALHSRAQQLRDTIRRIAVEPTIRWIDCQSRHDFMNFWDFDPVGGVGVHLGSERRNPLIWNVRFRDMYSVKYFNRIRANLFRLHYQVIMAGDQRAPYDFFMLVCGPLPISDWAVRGGAAVMEFSADATYVGNGADTEPRIAQASR
jgi:hypothetical protein